MKQRLEEEGRRRPKQSDADHIINPSFDVDDLGTDELANIVGFIPPEDIMRARLNKKMREVAKKMIVPLTDFVVESVETYYNAMTAMTTALPNLQQIELNPIRGEGYQTSTLTDDPDENKAAGFAKRTTHEINIIYNFIKSCAA
jgi:hypothetical protein